ncbi:MAG: T9SS type A sorting domain-containing protein [Ignavibacteria bacterium]|nr:T9SS type A sorting domain-containing protein [Ignavibacteria bacterium]
MKIRIFLFLALTLSQIDLIYSQSGWVNVSMGNSEYKGIFFPQKDTGFAIRFDGIVLKTINSGNNWYSTAPNLPGIITGTFTNTLLGSIWSIPPLLTTNGGVNWISMSFIPDFFGMGFTSGLSFLNEFTGFFIGLDLYPMPTPCCYDGLIHKTTNAGQNWIQILREPGLQLEDISIADENNIIVLASTGFLETTNGGNNWNLGTSLFSNIRYIHAKSMSNPFSDTIYVAGHIAGDTGVVAKSINSGETWTKSFLAPFKSRLRKLQAVDNSIVYAVGDTGLIVSTSNGGVNWTIHNSGTRKRLNGVAFINKDTGFAAGDSGLILKTFTGGITGVSNEILDMPTNFILHQNYPNPFNPSATIRYSIANSELVNMSVYDISGREVLNLVNEFKNAGSYSVKFNGTNFASGVYFYRIEAGEFVQTKRMVLIK